ncbi:Branched-chain amino acid transport system permease protein LivM (TC 3.A.1.4.1) [plant metagenome]|uniref:Branched-chain amino acid transport system permease protein LivM (TC 3.A.1.4.1) n=1 Tax=plant metagenome TaxID=1297885 RepID=A0A484NS85_9ZZZZ
MMGVDALSLAANVGLLAFLALSAYVLLIGGEISFGQQAFFGLGAYGAGLVTVLGGAPLWAALLVAGLIGALAGGALGALTLRLRGLYFSMSTLAAAEATRVALQWLSWRQGVPSDGPRGSPPEMAGPDGAAGFGGIRYIFEHGIDPARYVSLVWCLLLALVAGLWLLERSRAGLVLRVAGHDPALAESMGIDVRRAKLGAAMLAGAIAALGGALYAHYNTYIEPRNFDVMLGIHGVSYALIGGLGTPLGPLLGVALDIVLLEATRAFQGYRMAVFGGLVAVLLIVRPRGLLDEVLVRRLARWLRRLPRRRRVRSLTSEELP